MLETAFLKQTLKKKHLKVKKCFLSFVYLYACFLFVCLCVCLSVVALETSLFNIRDWKLYIDTYIWISQNCISIFIFFGVIPLFSFFTIFCISRLRVNLSWKAIHQSEAWDKWNILCVMILNLHSYNVTIWRHKI